MGERSGVISATMTPGMLNVLETSAHALHDRPRVRTWDTQLELVALAGEGE
jgi:hypothetical protein